MSSIESTSTPSVRLGASEAEEEEEDEDADSLERSSKPKSVWIGGQLSSDSGKRSVKALMPGEAFDFPKSVDLIRNVVTMATTGNDLILDFFAGSGTTGEAVMAQNAADGGNRRYVLVQLPEPLNPANKAQKSASDFCDTLGRPRNIAELTKERLRRAAQKIKREFPESAADFGFRVYKLATSNLKAWAPGKVLEEDLLSAADNLMPGRTEEALLVELLLKQGIDLTEPAVTRVIAGCEVHAFGGGALMVCLGEVTAKVAEALADGISDWAGKLASAAPTTIFFKDMGFENDQAKANIDAIPAPAPGGPTAQGAQRMKFRFESDLAYQTNAVEAVCDLFKGQDINRTEFTVSRVSARSGPDAVGVR